jgi:hypothetical protein
MLMWTLAVDRSVLAAAARTALFATAVSRAGAGVALEPPPHPASAAAPASAAQHAKSSRGSRCIRTHGSRRLDGRGASSTLKRMPKAVEKHVALWLVFAAGLAAAVLGVYELLDVRHLPLALAEAAGGLALIAWVIFHPARAAAPSD